MESRGVMQEIRELVAQGVSSGELIEMGYAPGSVFKAQREVRRRQGLVAPPPAKGQPSAAPVASMDILKALELQAQLQRSEEERARLLQAVAELEGEAARRAARLQDLEQEVATLRALPAQGDTKADDQVAEARGDLRRVQAELDGVTQEKQRLEKFMTDTNPTWRLGFGCWTREKTRRSPSGKALCSFGQSPARALPVCTFGGKDGLPQGCTLRAG